MAAKRRRAAIRRIIGVAAMICGITAGGVSLAQVSHGDEVTISADQSRDGWDSAEPGLSPATVTGGAFGQLFSTQVNGQVYAQPLAIGGAVIVATENNWVYSLNAETGAVNWSASLGAPWPSTVAGCQDMTPDLGVTSTPVYDSSTGTLYLVSERNNPANAYAPSIDLVALNAASGAVDWRTPVQGAPVNDPTRPFDPLTQRQRASLLLLNGSVYMGFGSICDYEPYVGYVAGVNTSTHALTMWTDESGTTDSQAGIWQAGGGLMSDGTGRIFTATGNGVSPAPGAGTSPPGELGDSVVRLNVGSGGTLAAQDYFSPVNAPTLDSKDQDWGSGAAIALPFGTSAHPHLLMQAGKDGRIFLLDRDNLGGRDATTDHPVYATPTAYKGQFGPSSAFAGSGGADYIYYHGGSDNLRALKFNTSTAALTDAGNSAAALPWGSGGPVVTSNGTDPASAVVWEENRGATATSGTLEAFRAIPDSQGQLPLLWSVPIGTASKFALPATDSGRVYVGTLDGHVIGFGSPDKAPLTGTPLTFSQQAAGSAAACQTVTVKATANVTVDGVTATSASASNPFTVNQPTAACSAAAVTFPQQLTAGQTLTVPVTFAPTAPGGATGALAFATETPNFSTVNVPVSGTGTQTGLYASSASLQFGTVPTGSSGSQQTVITNGGTAPETVTAVTPPTGPFSVSGLPATGATIAPGASVTLTVTYAPTAATGDTGSLSLTGSNGGTVATVDLGGTGEAGQGTLSSSPASVSFGSVPVGQQGTQTATITNTGNIPMKISGFTAPTVPFGTPVPVPAGITLGAGDTASLPVTFTPQSLGAMSGTYTLTASDGRDPAQTLTLPVTGTGAAPAGGTSVPSPGGGWTVNGSAQLTGTTLQLTPAVKDTSGSAVYYQPLASNGLHAQFTTHIGGGTGADGMTFALLDASKATPSSLGAWGGNLGFGTLPGVAVAVNTYRTNSIGIVTGQTAAGLTYAAKTTSVPEFRSGTHVIGVTVTGSTVAVTVDGKVAVSATVTMPSTVLAAFTGGNGSATDVHAVSGVSVSSGTVNLPAPGGGWSYNGSAVMAGPDTRVTSAVNDQAGSVVYPAAVSSNGLRVRFNEQIGGGTGADGMTLALLNPATASTAHGADGMGLGYAGLSGVAVAFGTHQATGYPSANFAALVTGASSTGALTFSSHVNEIGQLRAGTHSVEVDVSGGVLTVYFDGAQVLAQKVSLASTVKLAFTGGTGSLNDIHAVRDAAISVGAPAFSGGARSGGVQGAARAAAAPAGAPAAPAPVPTVELYTSADFSEVLTDSAGATLYRQIASCSAACASRYHPALLASGQQLHMPPLLPGKLGTVRLADGSLQLTYDGVRLYSFSGDHFPGSTNGVSLSWNVVQPAS